jgi:thiol-disulfide isomerase/thioredoxin
MTLSLLALLTLTAAANAKTPSPTAALSLKPVQADAVYETVPADQIEACTVSDLDGDSMTGWEVTSPDGTILRRFADTNGDKRIDRWVYFNFGVESYRDVDGDFNGKADQYRWLGNGGSRWGMDRDEDGQVDDWKRISAEEVTSELVAALRDADVKRFENLLATASELRSIGLGDARVEQLAKRISDAAERFEAVAKRQSLIGPKATWLQFAAPTPGLLPKGTDGSTADVLVYENVVAMYETDGQSNQLMVGTLVKVGDTWRLVGLPNLGQAEEPITQSIGVFFRPATAVESMSGGESGEAFQQLVGELEKLDQRMASADEKQLAELHAARADLVERLIAASTDKENRNNWTRQLIDTLSVAVQSGQYPRGLARLKRAASQFGGSDPELAAYADYQAIQAEYVTRQTPDADFAKVQEWYLDSLASFVKDHPRTEQAAQAMLQLALSQEFEDKTDEALAFYKRVRDRYEGTEAGKKAAGAVRRLESVGRKIELEGRTVGGKPFRLSALRGRPVVIHYWATWCEPCKQDMKLLNRLQSRYKRAGLTLVGINVDARRTDAEAFLRENRLPWIQLFEEGGLESSPLSMAFGVQTLPTMMLIDKDGTVVNQNIRAAELDNEIEAMLK